jgi:hypothetical protein
VEIHTAEGGGTEVRVTIPGSESPPN